MLIEKAKVQSRVFNLDLETDIDEWSALLDDPSVRVLFKKFIQHTETEQFGKDKTEVKEVHLYVEWETCSL